MAGDFSDNDMMDTTSHELLSDLSNEYETNYNTDTSFSPESNNVTNDSIYGGLDTFAQQYFEEKIQITDKQSTVEQVLGFPGLFLKIFGVDDSALLIAWNSAVYGLLVFLIGLYAYKAIKTGEVDG